MTGTDIGVVSACVLLGGMVLLVIAAVIYDIYVYRKYGVDATISRGMKRLGEAFPIFPCLLGFGTGFLCGLLFGHFFWSQ